MATYAHFVEEHFISAEIGLSVTYAFSLLLPHLLKCFWRLNDLGVS